MKNKRLVSLWLFVVGIGLFIFWGSLIAVDPLGIWHFPIIRGFNNYKVSQPAHLDFFKPYEYRMIKPDVVFLGSSRVYVGLCPDDYPDKSVKVYNMGMSSLSIRDAYQYLKFMIKVHKPKKVYLGLDFFQFNEKNFDRSRSGFSQKRLDKISSGWFSCMAFKLQETAGLHGMIKPTVWKSRKETNTSLFNKGWDVKRGKMLKASNEEYERVMVNFLESYQSFNLCEECFTCLRRILATAESEGVELVLFFNPMSSDLLSAIWVTGQYERFEDVKRRITQFVDYYDFAFVSEKTTNRDLFYDSSHYRSQLGVYILNFLNQPGPGIKEHFFVDKKNIATHLEKTRVSLGEYLISRGYRPQILSDGLEEKNSDCFIKVLKNNLMLETKESRQ